MCVDNPVGNVYINNVVRNKRKGSPMKFFEKTAQAVWAASDVAEKKNLLLQMVMKFKVPGPQNQFVNKWVHDVNRTNKSTRLDDMAAQLVLCTTDKSIK